MQVSLIITTYNRPDALLLVLRSVEIQTMIPDEIIIADDGSDQYSKKVTSNFIKTSKLNIIYCWQKDKGFRAAQSRNKSLAKSNAEYIILIDGDMILHYKFIEDHINNAKVGFFIQGSRALLDKSTTDNLIKKMNIKTSFFSLGIKNRKNAIHSDYLSKIFSKNVSHIHGVKTCNMSFFKQNCIEVNGFNNDFEGWGREDSEFAVRLLNNGIQRINVRFNALQFHLFHPNNPRKTLKRNEQILEETISKNSIWCLNGLSDFL
jgi:glycosyltransferase involved in cell wall biosynthesis